MASEMKLASAAQREQGCSLRERRRFPLEEAHIKTTSLLRCSPAGSAPTPTLETVMFRDGFQSEAASNVWVVKNGVVIEPA
jgi:hypothetical protein